MPCTAPSVEPRFAAAAPRGEDAKEGINACNEERTPKRKGRQGRPRGFARLLGSGGVGRPVRSVQAEAYGYPAMVNLCDAAEYADALRAHDVRAWYQALGVQPRGFAAGAEVWVRSDAAGLDWLVAHELGHVAGFEHVLAPTTMNPLGFLRWWDREGLLPAAQRALAGPP